MLQLKEHAVEVNVDSYIERLAPWDFAVTFKGIRHATRPLVMGDVLALEQAQKDNVASVETIAEFVASLFLDPKPDLRGWPLEAVMAVAKGVTSYWQERAKKNAEVIAVDLGEKGQS